MTASEYERTLETHIRQVGVPEPVREYRFHPDHQWRFDFAWPDRLIAVEVEGGTWATGRHSRGTGFELDCIKYAEAAIMGWRVVRVTSDMVEDGRAIAIVERLVPKGAR